MESKQERHYVRSVSHPRAKDDTAQLGIDYLDERIIRHLVVDGRISFRKLAHDLHVSTNTVTARVARLQSAGVLRGYAAAVDYDKLGYTLTAVTEMMVAKGKLLEIEREVARLPGVCIVYDVTGEIDGIAVAKFKNREDLSHFTKKLLAMPFVERTNTHVVLTTVREDFRVAV